MGQDDVLRFFDKISDIAIIAEQSFISLFHPSQVLCPYRIPEFQCTNGVLIALIDMLYSDLREVDNEIGEHVVALPSEFEQKLIDFLFEVCRSHDGQDEFEDLCAIVFVIEDVSQKDDTFSEGSERYFGNGCALF